MGIRTCSRQLVGDGHCPGESEKREDEKEDDERTH